jgi:hypothetical protein
LSSLVHITEKQKSKKEPSVLHGTNLLLASADTNRYTFPTFRLK